MWDSLQNLLPKITVKYNFDRQFRAIRICQEYRNLAPKILSPDALTQTFPKSYQDQTLTIGVYNSVWAGQLQMVSHKFKKALNEKFGSAAVKKIKIETCEHK